MKKWILILICYCCLILLCQGQNKKVDSLLRVLKIAKEDTCRVNTLNNLAKVFVYSNPDSGIYFAGNAMVLATRLDYKSGMSRACLFIGQALIDLGKYPEAIKNLNNGLKLFEDLLTNATKENRVKFMKGKADALIDLGQCNAFQGNWLDALKYFDSTLKIYQEINYKKGIALCYNRYGVTFYSMGNFPEALKNFIASVKINEELGSKGAIAGILRNIGSIYDEQDNYTDALKNYFASLKIHDESGDKRQKAGDLNNIGIVYQEQGKYDEALKYYSAALKINEELGNKLWIAFNLNNIGVVYFDQGNYAEALKYHLAVKKIDEELGDKDKMAAHFISLGNDYGKLRLYNKASFYLKKGLFISKELGDLETIRDGYKGLSDLDSAQTNYKNSLENYKKYISSRDSLTNRENTKKTLQIRMQYEFDKKESLVKAEQKKKDDIALKELQKQKLLKNFSIGAIGLVLILFFFVYRTYRARQELRLYDIRNRIAGDLHDDIGSTLNSISIYSEVAKKNDEHHDEALEMIGDASRKVIEAMSDIVWTINAENDSLAKIIFRMKSLAYNLFRAKNIEFTFHSDEVLNDKKLSLEERRNFYLIFKEAVNNLVKYANATSASITLTNENNQIRLRIQDDGVGFNAAQENAGNGLKNMKRRAEEMNSLFQIESQVGKGTQIELILKA